jgi:hypothetical protein
VQASEPARDSLAHKNYAWHNNRANRVALASDAEFRTAFNDALLQLTASRVATSIMAFSIGRSF